MPVVIHPSMMHTCPKCHKLAGFETQVFEENLPVILLCPHCHEGFPVETPTKFAKKPPEKTLPFWTVRSAAYITESTEVPPVQENPLDKLPPEARAQVSFRELSDLLAGDIIQGLQRTEQLKMSLDYIARKFVEQFQESFAISNNTADWDWGYVLPFIKQPFLALPMHCDDPNQRYYTRLVVAPFFYRSLMGFPIHSFGGFHAQIVNSYSRLFFPLERWMTQVLESPANLQLEVVGNRIIGPSLLHCWKEIPGTVTDDFHKPDEPSVVMREPAEARGWLAQHACIPWQATPIPKDHIAFGALKILEYEEAYKEPWRRFAATGRLLASCDAINYGRGFAAAAGIAVKGATLVIVPNDTARQEWKETLRINTFSGAAPFAIHTWEDFQRTDTLNVVPMLIVEWGPDMPDEFLAQLHLYTGKLIVLIRDPLVDAMDDNVLAPLLYGLTASYWMHMDVPLDGTSGQWRREIIKEGVPIWDALQEVKRGSDR